MSRAMSSRFCLPPKSVISLSVLLVLLLRQAVTVAPGDEHDTLCSNHPEYPVTIKVLMDSWRYSNLLSENGVWTTYNDPGSSEEDMWSGNGMCRNSQVSVCSQGGTENRVLETQIINKSLPSPDIYPVRVFINVTFRSFCMGNTEPECENNVTLIVKDNSNGSAVYESSFDQQSEHEKQFYFDVEPNEVEQFQVKLISPPNSGCIVISRVLIYRNECPSHERQSTGLSLRPSVQAPINGSIYINTSCTENAHHSEFSEPDRLRCASTGSWINDAILCQCNDGFYRDGSSCRGVVVSPQMYVNVTEEQGIAEVCFISQRASSGTVNIITYNSSASTATSDYDYIPTEREVSFMTESTQCINITIVRDTLTENDESFSVNVLNGSGIIATTAVTILSNGNSPCNKDSVILSRDVNNSSLQLVEMCGVRNEGVWSPPCDNDWTERDATVVCRELGYSSVANWTTLKTNAQSNNNIGCTGHEASLAECYKSQTPFTQQCNHLLLECMNTIPSLTNPTGNELSHPMTSDYPIVTPVSNPDIKESGSSSSEDNSSLPLIAASVIAIIIAAALTVILAILLIVVVKKRKLKHRTDRQNGHLTNPVYDATANGTLGKTSSSSSSNGGVKRESREDDDSDEEEEESTVLHNPLYSRPNGTHQKISSSNGDGATHKQPQYDDPQYSVPEIPKRDMPSVTSPTSLTLSSLQGPSPSPPHTYDYATVPRLAADPEYAPLQNIGVRGAPRSNFNPGSAVPPTAAYHTLEPPVNTVTYHVLESPVTSRGDDSTASGSANPESLASQGENKGAENKPIHHEYSTLQHDGSNTEVLCEI